MSNSGSISRNFWIMRRASTSAVNEYTISVWVRDPRIQKNDYWHAYIDYEVCLHTDSVFFNKKISRVRRRYSEFVWLRQKLQQNALLMAQLPELPSKNPFFSLNNAQQVSERMKGLQRFLEQVLRSRLLLSDSCLHLFLQSQLGVSVIEACAAGRTDFSVSQAVQRSSLRRFHSEEDLHGNITRSNDLDSERYKQEKTKDLAADTAGSITSLDLMDSNNDRTLSSSSDSV